MAKDAIMPLIGAVREVVGRDQGIAHAIRFLRGKGFKDMDNITENQFFHTSKGWLYHVGCDLVSKKNHLFIVCGCPYFLALALCTKQLMQNIVCIFDSVSFRETFMQ